MTYYSEQETVAGMDFEVLILREVCARQFSLSL